MGLFQRYSCYQEGAEWWSYRCRLLLAKCNERSLMGSIAQETTDIASVVSVLVERLVLDHEIGSLHEGKGRGWGSELRGKWGLFSTFRGVWVCCSGLNSVMTEKDWFIEVMMLRFRASRFTLSNIQLVWRIKKW